MVTYQVTGGTADAGSDFVVFDGTFTFGPQNSGSTTVFVPVIDDVMTTGATVDESDGFAVSTALRLGF